MALAVIVETVQIITKRTYEEKRANECDVVRTERDVVPAKRDITAKVMLYTSDYALR